MVVCKGFFNEVTTTNFIAENQFVRVRFHKKLPHSVLEANATNHIKYSNE